MRLHRVVGGPLVNLHKSVPLIDERLVSWRVDALEVVPGRQISYQRFRVEAGNSSSPTEKATTGMSSAEIFWLPSSL